MKPSTSQNSFTPARRALLASAMFALLGTATAIAQTSGTSSGATGSSGTTGTGSSDTSRRGGTTGTGSSSSTGSYDTGSSTSTSPSSSSTTTPSGAMTGRDSSGSSKLASSDRRFIHKAADNGQAELQVAQLASQRATNPEVKSYAKMLVDDHTKANTELMSIASHKMVKVDSDDSKDRTYNRLNKKSGSEFDQEFVEHMIDEHEKDIKMFEKASTEAKDPEVRSFASKQVSSLRQHLQQAQSLRQTLMPTGRMDESSGRSRSDGSTGTGRSSSDPSSSSDSTGTQRDSSSAGSTGTSSSSSSGTTGTSGTSGSGSTTTPR